MARRDPVGIRLLTRNGHDWSPRYPLIVQAVNMLKLRSCLIDGEAVCCGETTEGRSSTCRRLQERERAYLRVTASLVSDNTHNHVRNRDSDCARSSVT